MEQKEKNIKFETAIAELESITAKLESGETTLDESLKLYEKGIALIRLCSDKLDKAEQKIKIIQNENGTMTEKDFTEQ